MPEKPRLRAALDGVPEYRAGRAARPGAFKLSSNENPFPPLPGVMAAVCDAAATVNRYPDFGSHRLTAALAERHGVSESAIALGTGSVAVLAQAIQALAGPGDEVVIPWRSFEAYPILVQLVGAGLVKVPLRDDHRHDLDAMADAVTERTRLVMICSPNNPTGTIVTRQELERFIERVPTNVVIALDEAYIEFVSSNERLDSGKLVAEHSHVIALRTFSKAFGLAGLRVGYAVAPPELASGLRKAQLPFGVSAVAEQAALASLASEGQLLQRVEQVVGEGSRVCDELMSMGVRFPVPHANFVWLPIGQRTVDFAGRCEDAGVTVRAFAGDGVRVTIGEPEANDRFLEAAQTLG